MAKKQVSEVSAPAQPQELRVSLPPDSKMKSELKNTTMGPCKIIATGRVTGYSMDKYGCSLTMELKTLDVDSGMGGDIKNLKEYRSGSKEEAQEEKAEGE